jgi:hypothetical protein
MKFLALVALLLLPWPATVHARAAGDIDISATVNVHAGTFELTARVIYPLNDDVRAAVAKGATVNFDLQAVVERKRRYWLDATQVDVMLRREISWDAVSQRYILKEVKSGDQSSFVALDEAVAAAGLVSGWPVLRESKLDPDASYEIRVRAGYRRGSLPDALRALVFWSNGWNRSSEWKSWLLPR